MLLDKTSAVYKIFYYYYECNVPTYSVISEAIVSWLGFYGTESSSSRNAHVPITVLLSIDGMVEKIKDGVPIEIINPIDAMEIYEIIMDHLDMWCNHGMTVASRFNPPIEDLTYLDRLAAAIHTTFTIDNTVVNAEDNLLNIMVATTMDGSPLEVFERDSPLSKIIDIANSFNY